MDAIVNTLIELYGIECLWHFTDKSNISSIRQCGLLSLARLRASNIQVNFGANDLSHKLDEHYGLDRYVHLSFVQDHPMFFVINKDLVWIRVSLSVLFLPDVMVSSEVANKNHARLWPASKVLEVINFDSMFGEDFDRAKEAKKAEILVPDHIDPKYLHFPKG